MLLKPTFHGTCASLPRLTFCRSPSRQLFGVMADPQLQLFDPSPGPRRPEKQETHSLEAVKLVEHELKTCLEGLAKRLFGGGTLPEHSS